MTAILSELRCANHPQVIEGLGTCSRCGQTFCGDCVVAIGGLTFCGACKTEQLRDLASGIDATRLSLASRGRRFVALLLDNLPPSLFSIWFTFYMQRHGHPLKIFNLYGVGIGMAMLVYEGLMLQRWGQTLGKMAFRITVVRADGSAISAGQAWGRAIARRILDYLFFINLFFINYFPAFFTEDRLCIHDMLAKTRVVDRG